MIAHWLQKTNNKICKNNKMRVKQNSIESEGYEIITFAHVIGDNR